jgi:hypothetical protein
VKEECSLAPACGMRRIEQIKANLPLRNNGRLNVRQKHHSSSPKRTNGHAAENEVGNGESNVRLWVDKKVASK